jgi:predicted PurR-regulated permease PerM
LSAIQLVIGNFLEPKLLGNSLNISPLVALVSLSIWGAFWGVVGMVLSVPFTVIIIILLAHFSSTKSVAIMLSNKGDV